MGQYLLGIDNGSTVSKAALFDLYGREVAVAKCSGQTEYPHPGWTERDMGGLWESTAGAIRAAIARAGIHPQDIAAVGSTGHGNGLYLIDRAGQPLGRGILSMDTRAADVVAGWGRANLHARTFPISLQSHWPAQPNALLAWIKHHQPERYERIGAVLMVKDYIKYCLTGEASGDYSDMSAANLVDVPGKCYSQALLELYGIPEMAAALPRLLRSHEIAGQVTPTAAAATGLAAGTPVVSGLFDVDACAIGSGVVHAGQASIVMGSWSINDVMTEQPIVDPALFMTTLFADLEAFLTIEGSATSATNLEWFVSQFCAEEHQEAIRRGVSVYEVCSEEVAGIAPECSNIIFHPFLYGSNVQSSARAGFYGMAGWHTRAHLLRALFEGVVFSHLSHIEKLRAAGGRFDAARLAGGGSRSPVWSQMFADAIDLPMEVPGGSELGALGAALAAGVGAGVYRTYAEAVEQAVAVVRVHTPIPANTRIYRARYTEYCRLTEGMSASWEALSAMDAG